MMYGGFHGGFGWPGMIFGGLFLLLILVGLVFIIVWAVRGGRRHGMPYYAPQASGGPMAKDILQARFAKGEITKEQYREMLAEIES